MTISTSTGHTIRQSCMIGKRMSGRWRTGSTTRPFEAWPRGCTECSWCTDKEPGTHSALLRLRHGRH